MNRWLNAGASASASAAAACDPEDMAEAALREYLKSLGQKAKPTASYAELLCTLTDIQIVNLAKNIPPHKRLHNPIEQNTDEWFFVRRGEHKMRVGGSEVGVILGVSKHAKPYSLYQKIVAQQDGTWDNDPVEAAPCTHGHTCEPIIADMFEDKMGFALRDGGYYMHPDEVMGQFYGASPDRLVLSRSKEMDGVDEGEVCALLEIKAPFQNMYTEVSPDYMAQMQYQMWVSGLPKCYFLAVKLNHDKPEELGTGRGPRSTTPGKTRVFLAVVHYSRDYIAWMIPRLFYFTQCVANRTQPPEDLYDSPVMGLSAAPIPQVDLINVPDGSWRSRPNVRASAK